ncbi:MAG: helix-turn-helix domain-containing protein [Planctomycetes bacterium]|nr:helix-turn-helix domain-containing protein [Planctomycetota bacterium]
MEGTPQTPTRYAVREWNGPVTTEPRRPLPYLDINEACQLSGLARRTIRNLLHVRDPLLLAARLPGKAYRFHRERFQKWIEARPAYSRLPGVKEYRHRS